MERLNVKVGITCTRERRAKDRAKAVVAGEAMATREWITHKGGELCMIIGRSDILCKGVCVCVCVCVLK